MTETHELIELSRRWMDAWRRRDTALLGEILAPEFTLMSSLSTEPMSRADWLRYALGDYVCEWFEYDRCDVKDAGDAAVVTSWYRQKASVGGADRSGQFLLTDVWVRRDGKWQVIARHSSHLGGL